MSIITWNPNDKSNGVTLSNNNLTATIQNHGNAYLRATEGKSSGKWYWEVKIDNIEGAHALFIGVAKKNASGFNNSNFRAYYQYTGNKFPENESYGEIYNNINDVVSVLLDLDNGTLEFYLNGVSQGISHTDVLSLGIPVFPYLSTGAVSTGSSVISTTNFGATKFDIVDSNPKLWNQLVNDGYKPYDINNANWFYNVLIKSNNKYYTYRNNEFIEVEPTVENFKWKSVYLPDLTTPTNKAILTMEGGEVLEDGRLYRKTIDISKYKDIERIEVKRGEKVSRLSRSFA